MSAEQSTALTVQQRAVTALGITEEKKAELRALAARTTTITRITNADGYKQVHAARVALKNERVALEKDGKAAREEATVFSKKVIELEKEAIGIIAPEEKRLQSIQDAHDAEIEADKQARIDAELKRVQDIRDRIDMDIRRAAATSSSAMPSGRVAQIIEDIAAIAVDDSFAEFRQEADDAKVASLARLREIHTASVEREAEQARIKAEREELAKLRAEQVERDRLAEIERKALADKQTEELRLQRIEQDKVDAEAKRLRDEEATKQAAELKAQREKQDAEAAAERKRIADEEAEAKAIRDAAAKKLADERAEFERQQAEVRRAKEEEDRVQREQARLASINKPADEELLGVLAYHYGVPVEKVVEWVLSLDLSSVQAA
jgi:hypothetical protein